MRLSPASTTTRLLVILALILMSAPVQVDAAAAAARATKERTRSSPAKIPSSDSNSNSAASAAESKTDAKQYMYALQQTDFRTAPAPTNQKLDPSDPQFQAVHRHILTKLEDIVAGLQQTQEALRRLQNIAIDDNDPQLQTTIAQALTKVERALYLGTEQLAQLAIRRMAVQVPGCILTCSRRTGWQYPTPSWQTIRGQA